MELFSPTDHEWSLHELQEGVEVEGGEGFRHIGQWAALRGHWGRGPTVNSAVEEPYSRRVRQLNAEIQTERNSENIFLSVRLV